MKTEHLTAVTKALLRKEDVARVAALNLAAEFKKQMPVGTHFVLDDFPRKHWKMVATVIDHSPELGEVVVRVHRTRKSRRIAHKVILNALRENGLRIITEGE